MVRACSRSEAGLRAEDIGGNAVHLGRGVEIAHDSGGETVPQCIASHTRFAQRSAGTRTALGIASISGNFCFGRHDADTLAAARSCGLRQLGDLVFDDRLGGLSQAFSEVFTTTFDLTKYAVSSQFGRSNEPVGILVLINLAPEE